MPAELKVETIVDYLQMLADFHGWDISKEQQEMYINAAMASSFTEEMFVALTMDLLSKPSSEPEELLAALGGAELSKASEGQIRVGKLIAHMKARREKRRSLSDTTEVWRQIVQSPISVRDRIEYKRRVG